MREFKLCEPTITSESKIEYVPVDKGYKTLRFKSNFRIQVQDRDTIEKWLLSRGWEYDKSPMIMGGMFKKGEFRKVPTGHAVTWEMQRDIKSSGSTVFPGFRV